MYSVLARYPPLDSEFDEVAHSGSIQALGKELEKPNARKDVILPLMRETFPGRYQHILSESSEISYTSIIEDYPVLVVVRTVCTCSSY